MSTTTNYGISDADGCELTCGLPEHTARATAQAFANRRGDVVELWPSTCTCEGGCDCSEEFEPDGEGYSAEADEAGPSTVSDAPARDVEVTLTLPSGATITDNCTLWPHADGRPGYGTSGTPIDGWMGGNLVAAIRKMHEKARAAAIEAVLDAAAGACRE